MADFDWEALKEPVSITIDLAGLRPAKAGWALASAIEDADREGSTRVAHVLRSIGKALVELDAARHASAPVSDDELGQLAQAATAGEWLGVAPTIPLSYLLRAGGRSLAWVNFFGNDEAQAAADAAYITAVQPARVLALLADVARWQHEANQLARALAEAHGRLDAFDVPSARHMDCDDPACLSQIGHRVKTVLEDLRQTRAEVERLTRSLALTEAAAGMTEGDDGS